MESSRQKLTALIEREKQSFDQLVALVLEEKGLADMTGLSEQTLEDIGQEIEADIELRFRAGTIGNGATERERAEDEWVVAARDLAEMSEEFE